MSVDIKNVHPTFLDRVQRACAATRCTIWSGARSIERQAELVACFERKQDTHTCDCPDGCHPANAPGTSNHNYGMPGQPKALAVDLTAPSGDFSEIHARAEEFSLCFPVASEDWHAQPIEVPETSYVTGAYQRLPDSSPPPIPPDPLGLSGRTALMFAGEQLAHPDARRSPMLVVDGGLPRWTIQTFAGKAMDVPGAKPDDGLKIQQWELNGSPAQSWYIDPCGADEFRLIAVCSGRVLDIAGAGPAGTQLIQWAWNGTDNQRWRLRPAPGGTFTIESKRSGLVVDVGRASADNGAPIVAWTSQGTDNQRFRVVSGQVGRQVNWSL